MGQFHALLFFSPDCTPHKHMPRFSMRLHSKGERTFFTGCFTYYLISYETAFHFQLPQIIPGATAEYAP